MRTDKSMKFNNRACHKYLAWLVAFGVCAGCQSDGRPFRLTNRVEPTESSSSDDSDSGSPTKPSINQVAFDAVSEVTKPADVGVLEEQAAIEGMIAASELQVSDEGDSPNSIEALEAIAIQNHPAIIEARGLVDASRGQYVQAGLPFNPLLQYQAEEVGDVGSAGLHTLRVSQQFITANKLGLAQQVEAQTVARRSAELQRAELIVLTRVRVSFAKAFIAQQRAEVAKQIVELAEQSVQSAKLLYEAQEVSKAALLQVRVEAQQARIGADNAVTILAAQRRALAAAVGVNMLPPSPLVGEAVGVLSEKPWEVLVETITKNSPELLAAGSNFERARWALRLACAQVRPNITGQAGVGVDTISDDAFAVFGVSVPLPIRNRNQGNIRSARAEVATAAAASERIRLDLESRLANAVGRYQAARLRHQRLRDQVLPNAVETYELSRAAFDAGESNYLQLLTSQRTLFATELRILDALGEAKEAAAEIDGLLVTVQ